MIGAFICVVLGLALLPTTLNMARRATHNETGAQVNPNITSTQAGLVNIVPLMFIIVIIVGAAAGILMSLRRTH